MDLKSNNENECMSENCEPADNLELERDDSGGTEDSMEGELVGNTLTINQSRHMFAICVLLNVRVTS